MEKKKTTRKTKKDEPPFGLFVIGAMLVLLSCMALIGSCNESCPKRDTLDIVIQIDLTEAQIAKPDANEIIRLYGFDTDKWNGASFSSEYLTDVSFNRRTNFALAPGGNRITSSSFARDREVKKFEDSIRTFLGTLALDTAGRPHSSIWLPIASELTRLAQSKSTKRILIVYSDLMQNDPSLSFYDKQTFTQLQTDPDKITEQLLAKASIPDLSGITVQLVYEPADAQRDERYRIVSEYFKALLESHNATVTIGASIFTDPIAAR